MPFSVAYLLSLPFLGAGRWIAGIGLGLIVGAPLPGVHYEGLLLLTIYSNAPSA